MNYLLVENKQTILLGPTHWRHRFIQSELDDLEIDFKVSPTDPNEYVKISETLEIFPIVELTTPSYDTTYEALAGPFWSFENNEASGYYDVVSIPLEHSKAILKSLAASERYKKECAGTKITIQEVEVSVSTDRDSKKNFESALVAGSESVQWKFPETWLTLSLEDLKNIVSTVNAYVQEQFNWEKGIVDQIDSAQNVEELKAIVIIEEKANPFNNIGVQ